jgi:hypothetical protein
LPVPFVVILGKFNLHAVTTGGSPRHSPSPRKPVPFLNPSCAH